MKDKEQSKAENSGSKTNTTPQRWEQITDIYSEALELETSERLAFLNNVCADDEDLRREVESLLAANSEAGDFIEEPIAKDVFPLLEIEKEPSLIGQKLERYQVISQLGAGGMGKVYLAVDTKLGRKVALKTLPGEFYNREDILQRFKTEARAAATLNHPNIATLYSVEEIDGFHFFTMEYVEGRDLSDAIPPDGLDQKVFFRWFIALADALTHSHEKGIIHRDIKPSNIIITPGGVPKILDFGLAQIERPQFPDAVSTLKMTQPGQILGTPSYMSPEQAEGKEVDARSDIFSFGVVMYEAISGQRLFTGDNYATIISSLLTTTPPSISETKPETPYLLSRLVDRCLSKSRATRFQTMREVRVLLEEIQAALEAGISMDNLSEPIITKPKISFGWIIAGAISLIILLAGLSAYRFLTDKSKLPINFSNVTLRKLSQTNDVLYAQITPDGKMIAFNTFDENDDRSLWIRRIEDKNALLLFPPQPVSFWGGLTFSHDGSYIYYITAERDARHGNLYRISSLGGTPRKIVETVNDLGSLSPDSERVLYVRYGERCQILSASAADGSDERVIISGEANQLYRDPQFSADGQKIYFIRFENLDGQEFWSLVEIGLDGGEERVILERRKPKISELITLKDGDGLLLNATDEISNLPQLYYLSLSTGKETRITNDLNSYFGLSVSDDGKTIVTAQRSVVKDIWVASGNQYQEAKKLTSESSAHENVVFTPDGRIVYDAVDNNRPHIWIMNPDGRSPQQLTPNNSSDYEPRVSRDGKFIVFTSDRTGERKVWRMDIDGSNPQLLTPVTGAAFGPIILPDGQNVLFQWGQGATYKLGKVPILGGAISQEPRFSQDKMAFSPDGKEVAFTIYDEAAKKIKVRVRPADADEPSKTFDLSPTRILLWSTDSKGLLYRKIDPSDESSSTLWFQAVTGGEPKQVLNVKPDTLYSFSLSNDGSRAVMIQGKLITNTVMLSKIKE